MTVGRKVEEPWSARSDWSPTTVSAKAESRAAPRCDLHFVTTFRLKMTWCGGNESSFEIITACDGRRAQRGRLRIREPKREKG